MSAASNLEVKSSKTVQWWKTDRAKKVGAISAVIFFVAGILWAIFFRPYISTDDARVSVALIRIAPETVSGKVIKINVKEGDRLIKGATVLELDHGVSEANLKKAKAKSEQASRELKRMEILAAQNGISSRELDNSRVAAETAGADLSLAQIAYDRTFLKSPINGLVIQKLAEEGNILEANQAAVTVADIDNAWVSANIEETAVHDIQSGQEVLISIDEGGTLRGHVSNVRAATASQFALIQSENPSGNFTKLVQRIPVRIDLDPHLDQILRAGQSVAIRIRAK